MQRALILDANQRSALAATRCLGRHGIEVLTADFETHTLSGASKFSRASLQYPNPSRAPREFAARVAALVREQRIDLLLPMTDLTTMLLVDDPTAFAPARLACARSPAYEALTAKDALVERANSLGIPTPAGTVVRSAAELLEVARNFGYPLVVKPSRSRYLAGGAVHTTQVRIARSAAEIERIAADADWLAHVPGLVQEFIPGFGAGIFALGDGADVVAWFAHRRIREKPPAGGVSVLCESVAPDPVMLEHSRRLLKSVSWFGPAMIEFRVRDDGQPFLMEVNGRFWGSLQLSIDSGIEFPWLLAELTAGAAVPAANEYKLGCRLRWLLGDVDNLIAQLRGVPQSGSKLRVCGQFLRSFVAANQRQEIFRWSDPNPAFREARRWLAGVA